MKKFRKKEPQVQVAKFRGEAEAQREYAEALRAGREAELGAATPGQALASICDLMLGRSGYQPHLVWAGAQNLGMEPQELVEICRRMDPERLYHLSDLWRG